MAGLLRLRLLKNYFYDFQMMPNALFRYRPLNNDLKNNNQQIDAFKNDALFAVTADRFNDSYDTLVRYDQEEIKTVSKYNCKL